MQPSDHWEKGMGVERESKTSYGRFKALEAEQNQELERLEKQEKVNLVLEELMNNIEQEIEEELVEKGFVSREREMPVQKFQEIQQRLQNIENEWSAALENKKYSEIEESDLESLKSLVNNFKDAVDFELKASKNMQLLYRRLEELELDEDDLEELRIEKGSEASEKRVGRYLQEVSNTEEDSFSKNLREKIAGQKKKVREHILSYENQVSQYKHFEKIFKAMEKELEQIRESKRDDEELLEQIEEVDYLLKQCEDGCKEIIEIKKEAVRELKKAENVKKSVSKAFLKSML